MLLLPVGTPAAKVNILSAVCSACSSAFTFATARTLCKAWLSRHQDQAVESSEDSHGLELSKPATSANTCTDIFQRKENQTRSEQTRKNKPECAVYEEESSLAATLAAAMYSLSGLNWRYSTQAEVFALNNLFVSCLCFLTTVFCVNKEPTDMHLVPFLGAFLIGLGLTNQHTLILVAGPLAICVLWHGRAFLSNVGSLLVLIGCVLWGLFPYVYLIFTSSAPTNGSWGDCTSLGGFLRHLLRQEYGTWRLYSGEGRTEDGVCAYLCVNACMHAFNICM